MNLVHTSPFSKMELLWAITIESVLKAHDLHCRQKCARAGTIHAHRSLRTLKWIVLLNYRGPFPADHALILTWMTHCNTACMYASWLCVSAHNLSCVLCSAHNLSCVLCSAHNLSCVLWSAQNLSCLRLFCSSSLCEQWHDLHLKGVEVQPDRLCTQISPETPPQGNLHTRSVKQRLPGVAKR